MTGERKLLRILVLVIAVLYFLVFLGFLYPNLDKVLSERYFFHFAVFITGLLALSVSVYTFVLQLNKNNSAVAVFSGLCLALAIVLPIGHLYRIEQATTSELLNLEWNRFIASRSSFQPRPWFRATEGELRDTAILLRQLKADINLANDWLERIQREKISGRDRRSLRQKVLCFKLGKEAYSKELREKFVSLSRIWVREMVDGVEHSAKEDKEAARWKIAGVFQEIDKNSLGNQDAEILLLYRRAQMLLGNPRSLQFESFK